MDDNHTSFSFLTKGSQVEVTSDKDGFTGPWFVATVIQPPPSISSSNNLVYVEYHDLLTDASSSTRLREYANVAYVRPSPDNSGSVSFQLNDVVDAFCRDGWWTGVISSVLEDDKFEVTFQNPPYQIRIHISDLRVHRKWVGGKWVQPQNQGDTEGRTLMDKQREQTTPDIQSTDGVCTQKFCVQTIWKNWENTQRQLPSNYNSHGKTVRGKRGKTEQKTPTTGSSKKRGKLSIEASEEGTQVDSGKSRSQEKTPNGMGRMAVSQGKLLQKLPDEKTPNVAESVSKQPDVPLALLVVPFAPLDVPSTSSTVVDKEGIQGDASSVAPKRKRGRPPKMKIKISEAPVAVEFNHENEGVNPSAVSLVEGVQMDLIDLTIVNEQPELGGQDDVQSSKDELPVKNPEQDLHLQQGTKKYLTRKGKRGKRRTISVNTTEAPAQDSQDAIKEKGDGILEKDSTTKSPEPSVGKSLTMVLDDQPLSNWFGGKHTPMTVNGPDGTVEQSSIQLQLVPCDMDVENLPFVKTTPLWKTVESMEVFQKIPQRPHFHPLLECVNKNAREGIAIGKMVTFTTVVEKTCRLKSNDPKSTIEDCLETLVELERYGFEVEVIRERLTGLLWLKNKQDMLDEHSKGVVEKVEEHKIRGNKIDEEIDEYNRKLRELEEKRKQAMLKKEKNSSEIGVMTATAEKIKEEMKKVGKEFDELAAALF